MAGVMLVGGLWIAVLGGGLGGGGTSGGCSPAAPVNAQGLTSGQQAFGGELASRTGLDPGVVAAWMLAEESGGAAQARQAAGNNDWLNIGYTGSVTYGGGDAIWASPATAADATAAWLTGQPSIPGYGVASAGVQAILTTVGRPASVQIAALQSSGWAGSGYPTLPALYASVTGDSASAAFVSLPFSGSTACAATVGGVGAQRLLSIAQAAIGGPYSQPNHAAAFDHSAAWIKVNGTDCSGFVSWLLGPQGLGIWNQPLTTVGIPTGPHLLSGPGQQITIFNNPRPGNDGHVWIEILGRYFESAGGIGVHEMDSSEVAAYNAMGLYSP